MSNIALVIMDGVGIGGKGEGDMVWNAWTPTLDRMLSQYPNCRLASHGNADQMLDQGKDGSQVLRTAHSLNPVPFVPAGNEPKHRMFTSVGPWRMPRGMCYENQNVFSGIQLSNVRDRRFWNG